MRFLLECRYPTAAILPLSYRCASVRQNLDIRRWTATLQRCKPNRLCLLDCSNGMELYLRVHGAALMNHAEPFFLSWGCDPCDFFALGKHLGYTCYHGSFCLFSAASHFTGSPVCTYHITYSCQFLTHPRVVGALHALSPLPRRKLQNLLPTAAVGVQAVCQHQQWA